MDHQGNKRDYDWRQQTASKSTLLRQTSAITKIIISDINNVNYLINLFILALLIVRTELSQLQFMLIVSFKIKDF